MTMESITSTEPSSADGEKTEHDSSDSTENKENSTTQVSDAMSAAAGTSLIPPTTQTRFSFYDADEVQSQVNPSGKPTNRFNFYNAQEIQEQQIHEKKVAEEETEDILRSLQETEEQRMQILKVVEPAATTTSSGFNNNSKRRSSSSRRMTPLAKEASREQSIAADIGIDREDRINLYEDAIKDALVLLRRHRTPLKSSSVAVGDFPETVQLEGKTESMDDLLMQMRESDERSEEGAAAGAARQENDIADLLEEQKVRAKQRQERMAEYASRLQEFKSSLTQETTRSSDSVSEMSSQSKLREEEVQRGVEKVLLAILDRATSRGRIEQEQSASQETMNDALLKAMEDLLQGPTDSGKCEKTATNLKAKSMDSNPSKMSERSVVDELLAEVEIDDVAENCKLPKSMMSQFREEEKKVLHFIEKVDETAVDGVNNDHNFDDDDNSDDADGQHLDGEDEYREGDTQNDSQNMDRVLGPLSEGGATGVVLDIDQTDNNSSQTEASEVDDAAAGFSSVIDYVTSALHPNDSNSSNKSQSSKQHQKGHDKYTPSPDICESQQAVLDKEANELMRTLCAHLLPFGVDPSHHQLLQSIPAWGWDDENPNEAGYRIIRLSRSQLRRVEYAFETMINGFKRNTEKRLNDPSTQNNDIVYDANFYKDLQEAEKLLDEDEERLKTSGAAITKQLPIIDHEASDFDKASTISVETHDSQSHPDFPGIKSTGKGEMGDLEYFNLPIIFKSHVTGFEPTKNLILESGNVVAGQYLVESELGSAAFSTAYRCIDLSSELQGGHEEVCLKVIKNTKDFFDQSLDEIKILELLRQTGQVDENNIVKMKTFFYYREHLIIVTELLRQNLFEFGKFIVDNNEEDYFTIPRLAYITRQALVALRFVHSLGLVHSDIKPENILLGSYSRAKIKVIDFGSSCYLTDRQSSYIQSRSYRAPEVVLGLPYDGRIDVWSLGCCVAEMFTGEVTFQNDSIVSMLSRIEAICGPFPRHMIAQGRQSGRFFTKSGLLYEVVEGADPHYKNAPGPHDDDDNDEAKNVQFDIFQPKTTRLSCRLGFSADLMDGFDGSNIRSFERRRQEKIMFTDFVSKLLTIDPDGRPRAEEALSHPWMLYAASLTEEQIKYPSS